MIQEIISDIGKQLAQVKDKIIFDALKKNGYDPTDISFLKSHVCIESRINEEYEHIIVTESGKRFRILSISKVPEINYGFDENKYTITANYKIEY